MQPVAGYRPFAELARGAAVVYKAYDPRGGRTVLLKVLTPEAAEDPELVAWFEGEARAVADVEHENVVALYEAGRDGGRPFLAAEFVEGRSLADVLAEGPLPARLAAWVAASAARGLAAAHARGLLHRDVKPGNVMLAADGKVKLADFGLATRAGAAGGDGADVRGTPGYLAPEVVRGTSPGPASDLFALGAVLVESVTGRPAFPSAGAAQALDVALHHDPIPALRADPRVPPGLADIAERLLQKSAGDRPVSAAMAADRLDIERGAGAGRVGARDLAAFLDDPAAYRQAHPAPVEIAGSRQPARAVQRLRRPRTLVAVGVVVALVALALALRGPRDEPGPARTPPQEAVGGISIGPAPAEDTPLTAADATERDQPDDPSAPDAIVDPVVESPIEAGAAGPVEEPAPAGPPGDPEPAPAAAGQLTVAVEPWAEVFVDGRSVGTTPLGAPLSLAAGAHRVALRNPDFPEHVVQVAIPAGGSERLAVSLWSLVARVTVQVSPWARVSVDGAAVGTTPLPRALVLAPGTHSIQLSHPTLGEREERVTVSAGESRTVRVRMGG